jgi:hypothetical protein
MAGVVGLLLDLVLKVMQFMAKKRPIKGESSPKDTWQTAQAPGPMLHVAPGLLSPRRLRLCAIACCKSLWGERDAWPGYVDLLQLAELVADAGSEKRMRELSKQAAQFRRLAYPHGVIHLLADDAGRAFDALMHLMGLTAQERKRFADVLREVAGNPFADIHLNPALIGWRDGTIPKLAQACYDSNDFSAIGILGDALEDAECDDGAIIEHVRSKQTHYRGCWVVDLILGKK